MSDLSTIVRAHAISVFADISGATEAELTPMLDANSQEYSKDVAADVARVEELLRGFLKEASEAEATPEPSPDPLQFVAQEREAFRRGRGS